MDRVVLVVLLVDQLVDRVPPRISDQAREQAVQNARFFAVYDNPSTRVTGAVRDVLNDIQTKVALYKYLDLLLDALSLASIYFLAAIGLAITFGVMRVINMVLQRPDCAANRPSWRVLAP